MTATASGGNLIVLTADKNAQFAIRGLLRRHHSLGIRPVKAEFITHPGKDPGVRGKAHEFLRLYASRFAYALALMDREGCGQEDLGRQGLEDQIEQALKANGWGDRAAAIVLDPELENWVWSDSPRVDEVLGWSGREPDLRAWLRERQWLPETATKPLRPKDAMEAALREVRKPRSSAVFQELAERVSLERCVDPAFLKLKATLQRWFGVLKPVADG